MDRFDRIYALHKELGAARRGRSLQQLATALECDVSTAKRIIRAMRDYLGAPIVYDRELRAYRYDHAEAAGTYELPGLWFTGDELLALVSSHQLLQRIQPGLLDRELEPLRQRIEKLIDHRQLGRGRLSARVRILTSHARRCAPEVFRHVASALAKGQQLCFDYRARGSDTPGARRVSPQRLVHYRDNWYLDAWDHGRQALRTFALERIHAPQPQAEASTELADAELDQVLGAGYGIFAGAPVACAVLWFSAERARWVADEVWHPEQTSRWLPDGRFELSFPYSATPELTGDILRHGAAVEVRAPPELRERIQAALREASRLYDREGT